MYFVCIERTVYWIIWCTALIYALYQFATVCQSENHLYGLNVQAFRPGTLSNNLYDASDFEWQSFKRIYINYWYIVLIHFILSNVFTAANKPIFKLISWSLITLYATYTVFSLAALVVVIINVMMLILLAILGKNILSYALCLGVVIASQSTEIANRLFNPKDPRMTNEFDFEEKRFLFIYCLCFLNARGLSSALDNLTKGQKKEIQSGKDQFYDKVITIAAYLLYLPGFFAGPIYLYDGFEKATRLVKAQPKKELFLGPNYMKSMISLLILIINVIYFEWLLHWLYSSAVISDHIIAGGYNAWQFSGFIVSLCILFYVKYTCIYGTFKVLAMFDGVASIAPPLPQCPATLHLSSQLWQKFDVGIYTWLRRYIYDPIVLSKQTIVSRFMATSICFLCIALWHLPITPPLMIWICLNILGSFIEIWAKAFSRTPLWAQIRNKLSRPNTLRMLALSSLPLFLMAIVSNVYFLSNNELVGLEFIRRIFGNYNHYFWYLLFVLYCGANVSLDYNRVVASSIDLAKMHGLRRR